MDGVTMWEYKITDGGAVLEIYDSPSATEPVKTVENPQIGTDGKGDALYGGFRVSEEMQTAMEEAWKNEVPGNASQVTARGADVIKDMANGNWRER